jgi:hypothetical protein
MSVVMIACGKRGRDVQSGGLEDAEDDDRDGGED